MRTALAALAAALSFTLPASAQTYPDKPITVILPWAPGGAADTNVRSFTEAMSKLIGQPMVVHNRVGAAGTIGTNEIVRAAPDGYTIGNVSVGPLTTQPVLLKTSYSIDSMDYICLHYSNPQFFLVAKDAPYNTLGELQAWLKANPKSARFGSPGIGSIPHLAGLAMGKTLGTPMDHIPFKGDGQMLVSTLGGDIVGWITQATFFKSAIDRVKAIGVMSAQRMAEFPNVPTFREQGHDLVFDVWGGLAAPKGLPEPVRAKLEATCEQASKSPAYAEMRSKLGMTASYLPGKAFAEYIRTEAARNAALLKEAGVTP